MVRIAVSACIATGADLYGGRIVDEAALLEKIGELLAEARRAGVKARPDTPKEASLAAAGVRQEMAILEDSLDRLRLAIKYLVFDLEATKRENQVLRQLLE
jgi:hypothetical protein